MEEVFDLDHKTNRSWRRALDSGDEAPVPTWVPSNFAPWFWQPEPGEATLCDHTGVLIFAPALASLPAMVDPPQPILAQWLASTPLGAHNIEQTKPKRRRR